MKIFVSLLITAMALTLTPLLRGDDAPKQAPALAVVRTWGELLAQKPVVLQNHDGTLQPAYRLGIDCSRADLYGGAVIYCLVDGPCKPVEKQDYLGPFRVEVANPPAHRLQEMAKALLQAETTDAPMHLLMKIIPFNSAGKYTITIREPLDDKKTALRIVATAKIEVSKELGPPWHPWGDTQVEAGDADSEDKKAEAGNYEWNEVVVSTNSIALPAWPEGQSTPIATTPDPKLPLPSLFPAKPDPGIHLSIRDNWLIAKFDTPISNLSSGQESFLTRWWVNGKSYSPEAGAASSQAFGGGGTEPSRQPVREVRFRIEFDPQSLHVKKGDTIGVQLLHCPKGFTYIGPNTMAYSPQSFPDYADPAISRLSPRLDFTYTGDPRAMARK